MAPRTSLLIYIFCFAFPQPGGFLAGGFNLGGISGTNMLLLGLVGGFDNRELVDGLGWWIFDGAPRNMPPCTSDE